MGRVVTFRKAARRSYPCPPPGKKRSVISADLPPRQVSTDAQAAVRVTGKWFAITLETYTVRREAGSPCHRKRPTLRCSAPAAAHSNYVQGGLCTATQGLNTPTC